MKFSLHTERWPTLTPFRITGTVFEAFESVVVELADEQATGRGEALGVYYLRDTVQRIVDQVEAHAATLERGIDRQSLQSLLPPGGARNALDCALWDLEAKRSKRSIWALTGITPRPLATVFTIGIEASPAEMADKAAAAARHPLLKVKLDGDQPLQRMQAIRAARPDARLVVDANQGWTLSQLHELAPAMAGLGVEMIEQPLPRGADAALEAFRSAVPLCADESCLHMGELAQVASRYQMINIKLDKAGGLTHGLALAAAARQRGMGVMVGCMGGSSLAMAPAFVLGCIADLVDIDGPLLQRRDRLDGLRYANGLADPPPAGLWG
jgi:L-alanine-DL-glutamate epimerase-like enolase superfamily enzyme